MTKWDEFLKAEEEVRRGLAGAGLAGSTPKLPSELVDAKSSRPPLFVDPKKEIFMLEGPHGSVPIQCGVVMPHSVPARAFWSIGLTMAQALEQLATKHDIHIRDAGSHPMELMEFVRDIRRRGYREVAGEPLSKAALDKAYEMLTKE